MESVKIMLLSSYGKEAAKSIGGALQVDNRSTKRVKLLTSVGEGKVETVLEAGSLEKALPVLDDLLFCQSICERVLSVVDQDLGQL